MAGPSREFCQRVDSEMKQGRESITKLGPLVLFVTFGLGLAYLALVVIKSRSTGSHGLFQGILLFLVDHRNPSIWAHLVRSVERIKYGFEDRHPGQQQVLEKRGKYWSMAFLAALRRIRFTWFTYLEAKSTAYTFGSFQHKIQVTSWW